MRTSKQIAIRVNLLVTFLVRVRNELVTLDEV
jgi:hypothetical protein